MESFSGDPEQKFCSISSFRNAVWGSAYCPHVGSVGRKLWSQVTVQEYGPRAVLSWGADSEESLHWRFQQTFSLSPHKRRVKCWGGDPGGDGVPSLTGLWRRKCGLIVVTKQARELRGSPQCVCWRQISQEMLTSMVFLVTSWHLTCGLMSRGLVKIASWIPDLLVTFAYCLYL